MVNCIGELGLILLVGTDTAAVDRMAGALERSGYSVITSADGLEAVEIFQRLYDDITAVVVEMMLPTLTGLEVYENVRLVNAGTPVLLSHQSCSAVTRARLVERGFHGFLSKTLREDKIVSRIESVVDANRHRHPAIPDPDDLGDPAYIAEMMPAFADPILNT